MRKKAAAMTALLLAVIIMLSGCDALPFNAAENLVRPPRLTGAEGALQQAFDEVMADKGEYILKYPSAGDYKSAFVRSDCDGDGSEEAFIFYSLKTEEMSVNMYIMDYSDGQWQPISSMPGEGNDVYSIEFCDLNNDGITELLVGWSSMDSKTNKKLSVYGALSSSNELDYRVLAIESYTSMYTTDIDSDGEREILLALINSTSDTYTTEARLLKMETGVNDAKISFVGQCNLFSEITAINSISSSKTSDTNYVFIDETAGSSYLTEILYWDKAENALTPAFEVDVLNVAACPTSRSLPLNCTDINLDRNVEIPSTQLLQNSFVIRKTLPETPAAPTENIYITNWKQYDGEFTVVSSYISNSYDGFSFRYDAKTMADWSVTFYPDDGITQFFLNSVSDGAEQTSEPKLLFTIKAQSTDTVLSIDEYLTENEKFKYSCEITQDGINAGLSRSVISSRFFVD